MSQSPAILHLTLSFAPGGRRTAIQTLTASSKQECRHFLAVLNQFDADANEIEPYFLDSLELNRKSGIDLEALANLKKFCIKHYIAVVHAHDAASQMYGALLKFQLPKIKLIMTFHRSLAIESTGYKNKIRNALCGLLSDKILCASQERRNHYIKENFVSADKVIVIPLGVNVDVFQPSNELRAIQRAAWKVSDYTFVIGVIGHFGEEKGVDCAIEAFNEINQQHPDLEILLMIIGQGDTKRTEYLQHLAQKSENKIRFMGFRRDVPDLMQAMDCFLHLPRMEAFGLVLIEAMASGLPVIANQVGGIPDIVTTDKTGFLVQENNRQQVSAYLLQLYYDRHLAQKLGQAGRKIALSEFSDSQFGQRSSQLYQALLAH